MSMRAGLGISLSGGSGKMPPVRLERDGRHVPAQVAVPPVSQKPAKAPLVHTSLYRPTKMALVEQGMVWTEEDLALNLMDENLLMNFFLT